MEQSLKIRDRRDKGWFYLDNEYLNGYARIFGPVGTAIYVSLCRHANNTTQTCFPSLKTIADENGIGSENTVRKYIRLFEEKKIISAEKKRDPDSKKYLNTIYTLLDKTEWLSHTQPVSMDEPYSNIAPSHTQFDPKSHTQPVSSKETNINKTNIKETNNKSLPTNSSFSKFWSLYPKKELKKKSEELWESKKLDSKLSEILSFIEKANLTDRWKKGYIKAPPVFLRNECWNDDIASYNDIKRSVEIYKNSVDNNIIDKLRAKTIK
jgi:hypothetical protein